MRKSCVLVFIVIFVSILVAILVFILVTPKENLEWGLEQFKADIKYALSPPQKTVFIPEGQVTPYPSTLEPLFETPTQTLPVPLSPTSHPNTPTAIITPTLTPTPLPQKFLLSGFLYQGQMMNNCGPANLAMALSYWGWKGDQRDTAAFLKPNKQDKNVMFYEMEAFVEQEAGLQAIVRVGGDPDILKVFVSLGIPVIAEKGYEGTSFSGWMGHYQVVNGYDDLKQVFIVQDSYNGPDLPVPYHSFIDDWRAFNYAYMVIYPPERENQVIEALGLQVFDNFNYRSALQKAQEEASRLSGRDLYFALFNQGTNYVALKDYAAAAVAFDAAFANYPLIPEEQRPWRMLWYQTAPYFAYYYSGRYQDVVNLANITLDAMSDPILEESFYWRARAKLALGDREGAIQDLRQCLEVHTDFSPCLDELKLLGEQP